MTTRKGNMACNDFYCLKCGGKNAVVYRKMSRSRGKDHRKKLYCFKCKETLNFMEVRNYEEREDFLRRFNAGEFIEEAEQSIEKTSSDSFFRDFMEKGIL